MTSYWIPEDIPQHWARIAEQAQRQLEGKTNSMAHLSVYVQCGYAAAVTITTHGIEPASRQSPAGKSWWAVVRRLQSVASVTDDVMISTYVWLNARGLPAAWTSPHSQRLER